MSYGILLLCRIGNAQPLNVIDKRHKCLPFSAEIEGKPFEQITVTDIAEKAGVARLTFYRNYENKEQIILAHMDALFEEFFAIFSQAETYGLHTVLSRCFSFWQEDARLTVLVVQHDLIRLLYEPFGRYVQRVLSMGIYHKETTHFQRRFIEGGLLLTMIDWISDTKGETPEHMADSILNLIDLSE